MDGMVDPEPPMNAYANVCKQLEQALTAYFLAGVQVSVRCEQNDAAGRVALLSEGTRLEVPADPLGCLCSSTFVDTFGPEGTFRKLGAHTLIDLPDVMGSEAPQRTTYCQRGDDLQPTGADGDYLFHVEGLKRKGPRRLSSARPFR
jgi:hypothetical protein